MDLIAKERDRLLHRTARVFGLSFTIVSLICLSLPGSVDFTTLAMCIPLYVILGFLQFMSGRSRSLSWVAGAYFVGFTIIILATALPLTSPTPSAISAVSQLAGGSLASAAIVLTTDAARRAALVAGFIVVSLATALVTLASQPISRTLGLIVLGWTLAGVDHVRILDPGCRVGHLWRGVVRLSHLELLARKSTWVWARSQRVSWRPARQHIRYP